MIATPKRRDAGAHRRSTLSALAGLSVLAIVLRYPMGHEEGVDSFFIHGLAGAINSSGSMSWLVTPLSYFGLAAFSYSPAVPISLATFSQLGGLDLEPTILVYSLLLGAVTPWMAFLLGRACTRNDGLSLFLAFLMSSSGGMIDFTTWTVSTRGTFLVFVPLAIALFVRTLTPQGEARPHRQMLLATVLVLMTVHALWLLFVPCLIAAALAFLLVSREYSLLRYFAGTAHSTGVVLATSVGLSISLLALIVVGPTRGFVLTGVPQVVGGLLPNNTLVQVGLQYGTVVGIGVVLLPLGLIRIVGDPESRRRHVLIGLLIVFLPISLDPVYGILLALPVLLLASVASLAPGPLARARIPKGTPTRLMVASSLIVMLVLALPPLVTIPRTSGIPCQQTWTVDEKTYDVALYAKFIRTADSSFAWDDAVEASRIQAISGVPAVEPLESVGTLEYPWLRNNFTPKFVAEPDVFASLVRDQQLVGVEEWLPAAGAQYNYYWGKHALTLLQNSPTNPTAVQILGFYHASYAIERCAGSSSVFFSYLHESNYVVYADGTQRIYRL